MKTFRIWRTLKSEVPVELKSPRITKKGSIFPEGLPVCAHLTSPLWGYFHFKISRDTIHLLGEITCLWRVSLPVAGRWNEMSWKLSSNQTLLGWSYHSHTLSLYLHIQHYIIDHNLQWQKDATVKVITPNWERCLASFNLCHYQKGRAMNAHKNHYTKSFSRSHSRMGYQQREPPAGMGVLLLHWSSSLQKASFFF